MGILNALFKDPLLEAKEKKVAEIKATGFQSTMKWRLPLCLLAVDENRKEWVAIKDYDPASCFVHKYSDILDVQIIQDNNVVIQSNMAGAVVGGALFGAAGAVVGASSRQTATSQSANQGIRIILNNPRDPMVYIECPQMQQKDLHQFYALFVSMVNQANS